MAQFKKLDKKLRGENSARVGREVLVDSEQRTVWTCGLSQRYKSPQLSFSAPLCVGMTVEIGEKFQSMRKSHVEEEFLMIQ